ncbi:cytochrome c maturation protein CcmB [Tanacetum coccineum]
MIHMPKGAKVLKDLLSHKDKLEKATSLVKLSEECFAIIQTNFPQKEGGPGLIRIPPLFPFPSAPFPRNEKEDGTLELYYLSAYCLPKILLLQLVGHRVIQISRVFRGFPMLQLPYQFGRSGMDRLNIPLGSLVLTFLCGIHSRSALGITSSSGGNSSQNPTTSPTSLPLTLSRTSIETEWFHVLYIYTPIGYSFSFVSLSPILVSISSQD